jgi:acyl-homoserine-lactone acylase
MDSYGENPRGIHAIKLLRDRKDFTLSSLNTAAYDSYQPAFAQIIPPLIRAYDEAPAGPLKRQLSEQVAMLRGWDYRWSISSVPTSLAVFWGEEIWKEIGPEGGKRSMAPYEAIVATTAERKLKALAAASDRLQRDFGSWRTPWGEINRFQRLTDDIAHPFSDREPSIPVGFTSGRWGSLAAFEAQTYEGSKRRYGSRGNSFVAVVEFGDKVRARAVTAGGESGDPRSPHFNDQAERYATGNLREVYFYPAQLKGHTKRRYRPGQ